MESKLVFISINSLIPYLKKYWPLIGWFTVYFSLIRAIKSLIPTCAIKTLGLDELLNKTDI